MSSKQKQAFNSAPRDKYRQCSVLESNKLEFRYLRQFEITVNLRLAST